MKNSLFFKIAWRYLRGKGTANAVPILSRISMIALAVSACAMIVLFSVFNGFGGLIDDLYQAFYPDVKITLQKGKFFQPGASIIKAIKQNEGIKTYSLVLEDNVLVNTEEGDYLPVSIKGVDANYFAVNALKPYITKGNDTIIADENLANAIIGQSIAAQLGIDVDNVFARIMVFSPNANVSPNSINPADAFRSILLKPDGVFAVQEEFDSKYILAPLNNTQSLTGQVGKISSIEIKVKDGYSAQKVQQQLAKTIGAKYDVATRYQQNKAVYMVIRTEKWVGYLILLFVLLIASFNMVSALSLLVLEKQKDMALLASIGLLPVQLSKIVIAEAILWSLIGGLIGTSIGILLCWAQLQFGLIKIQGAFIIEAYPVAIQFTDVLVVMATVLIVGVLASIFPARQAASNTMGVNLKTS